MLSGTALLALVLAAALAPFVLRPGAGGRPCEFLAAHRSASDR
jgi:hypothetical protein